MKLIVPYTADLDAADARLVRLAEFIGVQCELLKLESGMKLSPDFVEKHVHDRNSCFVINPEVIREYGTSESFLSELDAYLTSHLSFVLIHNLSPDPFAANILSIFSEGSLDRVLKVDGANLTYSIDAGNKLVCGPFSGLNFGPVNEANDQVFGINLSGNATETHITIGGRPFFSSIRRDRAEVFFLGSAHVADLDANIEPGSLTEYFSQLIPPAMFIRYAFREECWRPDRQHATLIIDDPLLRQRYGFLDFQNVLGLMDQCGFHTSIAFIPHNWRRNAPGVIRMFNERPERYSICFHGNDHTEAELASEDTGVLNAMITVAEERMDLHQKNTGIRCDKIMVFPQGNFSRDAMDVLKSHNFCAAVNSGPFPQGKSEAHTLALSELLEPAILRYGGFPLFLRKYVREITSLDIAFNLFFGKPLLIVEHHEIFRDTKSLIELVSLIHQLAPETLWSNLQTTLENAYLQRRTPDGTLQLRPYANAFSLNNTSKILMRCSVEWLRSSEPAAEQALLDGIPWRDTQFDNKCIRLRFDLHPGESRHLALRYRNDFKLSNANRKLRWKASAFVRRRLSEVRDNHLSKHPGLLSAAKNLQKRFLN